MKTEKTAALSRQVRALTRKARSRSRMWWAQPRHRALVVKTASRSLRIALHYWLHSKGYDAAALLLSLDLMVYAVSGAGVRALTRRRDATLPSGRPDLARVLRHGRHRRRRRR